MSGEFYVLQFPVETSKGYCTLTDLEGFEDDWAVRIGTPLAGNPPSHLSMVMHPEEPRNTVLSDHVDNLQRLLIVSPRFRDFLVDRNIPDVEYYPMEIIDHKGKVASTEYSVVHLVNHVDCIDPDASGAKWSGLGTNTQRIRRLSSLVIDPSKVPAERTLFLPKFYNNYPIMRRDLADALMKANFTNVEIVPIEECAC